MSRRAPGETLFTAAGIAALALFFAVAAPAQQQGQINLRLPPPPPPDMPVLTDLPFWHAPQYSLMPPVWPLIPGTVTIPAGTRLEVILGSPLSTRITKTGDKVIFRTAEALHLHDGLTLPPETALLGRVTHADKPGGFGKRGRIEVQVERIELGAAAQPVSARLESADVDAQGRSVADNNRAADLLDLAQWTLMGTVIGREVKGGKGAAVGAGAGAAIAVILMGSRRAPDIYLEPGTPFAVILEQPVKLPAREVYAAGRAHARAQASHSSSSGGAEAGRIARDPEQAELDPSRPKLKRRPKPPQP